MIRAVIFSFAILLASCGNRFDIYTDQDNRFRQLNDIPEIFVVVKRDAGVYYKIVHFTSDWQFLNGSYEGNVVHEGYYIADAQGFNGYDLTRRHSSLDEAIKSAQSAGRAYEQQLGREYNYQSGNFYRNTPFTKLNKQ